MYFEPMLAEKYKKFTEPVYSQPKLDGIRNVVLKEGAFTRQGKPQLSIPHVIKDLSHLFILYPDLVIDGELYNHDLKSDFNKITSVVKKQKPTKEDLEESEKLIKYYVYDVYFKNSPNMTLEERYDFIFEHLSNIKSVVLIKTTYCETLKELNEIYAEYLTEGYEGQMIRKLNSIYENKRSKNLVKRKEFIDEEFVILDINEGVGNWQGKAKTILFLNKDGSTFSTGVKGNMDYCTDLLKNKNKYLNKLATVRYQELTPDGVPRFGVMYGVRDYE
jgi:DNA ligase-1